MDAWCALISVWRKCVAFSDLWDRRGDFRIASNCVLVAVGVCQLLTVLTTSLQTSVVIFIAEPGMVEQLLAILVV